MTLVFVAFSMAAFLAASMLAIDVGLIMTARAQAQNAADAGALAGAVSLVFDASTDRSPSSAPVQSAVSAATANPVMGAPVAVTAADVRFLPDPASGQLSWIEVNVFRTGGRANPLTTFIGRFFGVPTADIAATAVASAGPANAAACVRPWTIPDKWIERQTPPWDPTDTFDMFDSKGNPLPNPDVYVRTSPSVVGTGYNPWVDRGTRLMLKASTGLNIAPSFYFAFAHGGKGGAVYRSNIATCNPLPVRIGDYLVPEPGNMTGPTVQGVAALVAQDPTAYWDTVQNRVVSNKHPSPRIVVVPTFDPVLWSSNPHHGRHAELQVTNLLGVFVEGTQGSGVYGRITPITGIVDRNAGQPPAGAFPRSVRLER